MLRLRVWLCAGCRQLLRRCLCCVPVAADEEHLAACLQPPGELLSSPAAGQPRTLQHSTTDSLLQLHHQQQQQQHPGGSGQGRGGQLGQPAAAEGRGRRVTLGDPSADAAGGLLARPGGLPHSMSERPGSRGGGRSGPGVCWCVCASWHVCFAAVSRPMQHGQRRPGLTC
jgi:hypothetical protein